MSSCHHAQQGEILLAALLFKLYPAPKIRGARQGDRLVSDQPIYRRRSPLDRMNITPEQFAERIRTFRFNNRMTLEELSYRLGGISQSTLSKWENGATLPKSKVVISLLIKENVL